jgi:hypothetical protein
LKYISIIFLLLAVSACRTKTVTTDEPISKVAWIRVDFKPAKDLIFPNAYNSYTLNTEVFKQELLAGEIELPSLDGKVNSYKVKDSGTMSEALQAKFASIRSYSGYDVRNSLCQLRVDQKEDIFKIVVLCNDKTFYIQGLYDLGLYFIYDKKDLPEGVGTVKE